MAGRRPKSRRRSDGRLDEFDHARAYEFLAAEYGWNVGRVRRELTDEQLIAYLDAATDRITARAHADFDSAVEAVRVGTIVAHDRKAYSRWQSHRRRPTGQGVGLTGLALERAVMSLASTHPEYVVFA